MEGEAKEQENQAEEQAKPEAAQGAVEGAQGAPEGDVKDSHGQPGINKERHDKEVADLQAQIEALKAETAAAAEEKAKRQEFEEKVANLEAKLADTELSHKLELAGCRSVKAAKALLGDCGNDVQKLKAEHPYLFEAQKKGTTGGKPAGATGDAEARQKRAYDAAGIPENKRG